MYRVRRLFVGGRKVEAVQTMTSGGESQRRSGDGAGEEAGILERHDKSLSLTRLPEWSLCVKMSGKLALERFSLWFLLTDEIVASPLCPL